MEQVIAEAVSAARVRVEAARAANEASVKGTKLSAGTISKGTVEKFLREEVEARKDKISAAVVAAALEAFSDKPEAIEQE